MRVSGASRGSEVVLVIAVPVAGWVAVVIAVLGAVVWLYDLTIAKPTRCRERLARKWNL